MKTKKNNLKNKKKFKIKNLSPIIGVIFLIIISVILVSIILGWGKTITDETIKEMELDYPKSVKFSEPFIVVKLFPNYKLVFKNINTSKEQINIIAYKIISQSDNPSFNQLIYLDQQIIVNSGSTNSIDLLKLPPENKFNLLFLTDNLEYITLPNINNLPETLRNPQQSNNNIIYSFDFLNIINQTTINSDLNTINILIDSDANIMNLTPIIEIHNLATINPESEISQDFSNPITYTVTAQDQSIREYLVIVEIDVPDEITDIPINGEIWYLEHLDFIDTNSETLLRSYTLMRNLDFLNDSSYYDPLNKTLWTTGEGWLPIAHSDGIFGGRFYGQNYTIKNLYINRPSNGKIGLFSSGYLAQINNLRIEDCNVTGGATVGGLIGESMYNIIENTSVTGLVSGNYEVGGFIGLSAEDTISNSYSNTTVSGDAYYIGGFIGFAMVITGTNNYSFGSVTGDDGVGGFIGGARDNILEKNYSAVVVSGNKNQGGFFGSDGMNNTYLECFWDVDRSGQNNYQAEGIIGLSTELMKTANTFNKWNLIDIWNIEENITYPYLITNTQNPLPQ